MRRAAMLLALGTLVAPARADDPIPAPAPAPAALDLRDGDRVVFLGDALTERGQAFGYLETRLTSARPGANVQFRNLGWSGDTVFGEARAGFGTAEDGFKHLSEHVAAIKPTVILVGYGGNESFAGEAGLPAFRSGYARLLDVLRASMPRSIVLLAPIPAEDLGRPLPDPAAHNRDLATYRDAIREIAAENRLGFVDLFALLGEGKPGPKTSRLTDDGIHPDAAGYRRLDAVLAAALGMGPVEWRIEIEGQGPFDVKARGVKVEAVEAAGTGLKFRAAGERVADPPPAAPARGSIAGRIIAFRSLKPGRYMLKIDGVNVASADADAWLKGIEIDNGPALDKAEALRKTIVAKNLLYFYRWRPQNETYLFGFRKYEQGQNGREIPQFDPLVAAKEAEIAELRKPVARTYELTREGD